MSLLSVPILRICARCSGEKDIGEFTKDKTKPRNMAVGIFESDLRSEIENYLEKYDVAS